MFLRKQLFLIEMRKCEKSNYDKIVKIENVRLWFSWCVCATCLPACPWANRAVPHSSSDGAPTSCRAFLVRTLW